MTCCENDSCKHKAVWQDAIRPDWIIVIPPSEDASGRKDWEQQNREAQLKYRKHCEEHHKQFLRKYGEFTISQCIDDNLLNRLHLQRVGPHPHEYFPRGYDFDDEEATSE